MPDELTHVIIAFFIAEAMKLDKTWKKTVVIFGSVIPDIYKFLFIIDFLVKLPSSMLRQLSWFFIPLTAISGSILMVCLITLLFFQEGYHKEIFLLLLIGTASHLIADLFLWHFSGAPRYLIPFSQYEFGFNLIRSENYWMTIVSGVLVGIYLPIKHFLKRYYFNGF